MSLTQTLLDYNKKSRGRIPAANLAIMDAATQALVNENIISNSIKKGDVLPVTEFVNAKGKKLDLGKLLDNGPLVISFYRGGWCPYCNFELRALQQILPELKELGANLVAITPETPDNSLTTTEKNEIAFDVLTDYDNSYARELGLVFKMPQALQEVYNSFGIDIEAHNENSNFELPMPATLVVDSNREVLYSFVNEDYTKRADTTAILEAVKQLQLA
ncbi:peroxiredoxin-like family protein [uncultured Croceitalea sp.]|uniref:peroxiredoxin-like family protein n=1 Tax=uncultured Croceitalea sp. TaxID=1798908 RepID=UPI00374FB37D